MTPLNPLPLGECRPLGWVREAMVRDLNEGFVGHLDRLEPGLAAGESLYGRSRIGSGASEGPEEPDWLPAVLLSLWRSGWLGHVLLVGDGAQRKAARASVDRILAAQDADGYLGIYAPDRRFRFSGDNAELWAQAALLRGILDYQEATGDPWVRTAVRRAVARTLGAWPLPPARPWAGGGPGAFRGLLYTDVLDRLADLTGEARYRDWAAGLTEGFAAAETGEPGAPPFLGRALAGAAFHTRRPDLEAGFRAWLSRVEPSLSAAGGLREAGGPGYEFGTLVDLADTYRLLLLRTGDPVWADRLEHLLFNAALGARHPAEPSLAALSSDTCEARAGGDPRKRDRFSPVHRESGTWGAAEAGRLWPLYVRSQVFAGNGGLLVALFGPASVRTRVRGVPLTLRIVTRYPEDLRIVFEVEPDVPVTFGLTLRRPGWADAWDLTCPGARISETPGWVRLEKRWSPGDRAEVVFSAGIRFFRGSGGEVSLGRGPLVYGLPLASTEAVTRTWPFGGFRELEVRGPETPAPVLPADYEDRVTAGEGTLRVPLLGPDGTEVSSVLVPLKDAVLRRVAFGVAPVTPRFRRSPSP